MGKPNWISEYKLLLFIKSPSFFSFVVKDLFTNLLLKPEEDDWEIGLCSSLNTSFIFGSEDYGDLYHDEYSEKPTKSSRQPTGGNIKSITVSMGAAVKLSH